MSVSSSSNASLPPPPPLLPSSTQLLALLQSCLRTPAGSMSLYFMIVVSILFLLPLYAAVVYLGVRRHRRSGAATTNHSDAFAYHMVALEGLSILAGFLICVHAPGVMTVGLIVMMTTATGQVLFHILTCGERYLAVVHPIAYMKLRTARGVQIRNVTIGGIWLTCLATVAVLYTEAPYALMSYAFICLSLAVISFCNLSVLCVLIRPGPRDGGGHKQQGRQSKLRALYTITAILAALLLRFGGSIITSALHYSQVEASGRCTAGWVLAWFNLPSSLVMPLLYLQKAGKLACLKRSSQSGRGSR